MTTTVTYTEDALRIPLSANRVSMITWAALPSDGVGQAVEMPEAADRTVQFTGTFDTTTVLWEGSNDGTNYVTLTDPQGNAVSKTAASLEQIEEITRYMRPRISVGGASTAVTVTLLVRR